MDEAGLGPNFGPFVSAMTVWEVPSRPRTFDFWRTFCDVLTNEPEDDDARLHVADSKQVFQPQRGFAALERGVLSALRLIGHQPSNYDELCEILTSQEDPDADCNKAQWYDGASFEIPAHEHDFSVADRWRECCERHQVRLIAIRVAIIEPTRFNQLIRDCDNKSLLVSRVAFKLLRSVWNPDDGDTFIVADKHGGRNRYDQILAEFLDGEMIFRVKESAERSDYKVGKTVLRFEPRAEEHGPVALASMTAKYVRELAMTQFNRFWARHIDGLKPTQGYPVDSHRFREHIAETQKQLAISDDDLWRCR
jgi:hypothetical protein